MRVFVWLYVVTGRAWRGMTSGAILSCFIFTFLWNWTGQKGTERKRQAALMYSLPFWLSSLPLTTYQGHHFPPGDRPAWRSDWLGATMHWQRLLWLQVSWLTKQSRGIDVHHALLLPLIFLFFSFLPFLVSPTNRPSIYFFFQVWNYTVVTLEV